MPRTVSIQDYLKNFSQPQSARPYTVGEGNAIEYLGPEKWQYSPFRSQNYLTDTGYNGQGDTLESWLQRNNVGSLQEAIDRNQPELVGTAQRTTVGPNGVTLPDTGGDPGAPIMAILAALVGGAAATGVGTGAGGAAAGGGSAGMGTGAGGAFDMGVGGIAESMGLGGGLYGAGGGGLSGVDWINQAMPGQIGKGLTDAEIAGSVFAPSAGAGAGGLGGGDISGGFDMGGMPSLEAGGYTPPANYAGAFDQFGSLGTPMAEGIGGTGYLPKELMSYITTTGDLGSLSSLFSKMPGQGLSTLKELYKNMKDPMAMVGGLAQLMQNRGNAQQINNILQRSQEQGFPHQNFYQLALEWMLDPSKRYAHLQQTPGFLESQKYIQEAAKRRNARTGDLKSGYGDSLVADVMGKNAAAWDQQLFGQIAKASGMDFNSQATQNQLTAGLLPSLFDEQNKGNQAFWEGLRKNQGFLPEIFRTELK